MKKLLLLVLVFSSLACSREDQDSGLRSFFVEASVLYEGSEHHVNQEFIVYYFEGIDVTEGYSPQPDGILINNETGNSISYTRKISVNNDIGRTVLDNLPRDMHSFVIDMSNTFRQDVDFETIVAKRFNVDLENPDGGWGMEILFPIAPHTPSTIYQ